MLFSVLNLGYMFHIALGFFLFPYKLPQSFLKQSCQLCLFQSLIYKEPVDEGAAGRSCHRVSTTVLL